MGEQVKRSTQLKDMTELEPRVPIIFCEWWCNCGRMGLALIGTGEGTVVPWENRLPPLYGRCRSSVKFLWGLPLFIAISICDVSVILYTTTAAAAGTPTSPCSRPSIPDVMHPIKTLQPATCDF